MATLRSLGWREHFAQQLSRQEQRDNQVGRVFGAARTGLQVVGVDAEWQLPLGGRWFQQTVVDRPTVGDWLLLTGNRATPKIERLLTRSSLITRVTSGRRPEPQPIAANVDTLFIVSSCNDEFNLRRLERYVALAYQSSVAPVLVLTKVDICDSVTSFESQAAKLQIPVVLVNATAADELQALQPWCGEAQTVALVGSSGVGKSTLVNSLLGSAVQVTGAVRTDDSKGRHTTTHRSLHQIPGQGLLLDSPGIRELQISDAHSGVREAFADVETLARQCRFNDCRHASEPGCAVLEGVASGDLSESRLASFLKLLDEQG